MVRILTPPPPGCDRRKITVFSTTLAAFTIDHGESKPLGPDLLVSYHDNDHYNSVRDRTSPPKPVKNDAGASWKSCNGDDEYFQGLRDNVGDGGISKDIGELRIDDPANDFIEAAEASFSDLSLNETKSKVGKDVKKAAPCPCGSGMKYKKCCLAKQKRATKVKRLKGPEGNQEDRAKDAEPESEEPLKSRGQFQVVSI